VVLFQGSFLAFLGSLSGILFSLITAYVINEYKLISLPKDIYMIDHLRLDLSILNISGVFLFVMLLSLVAAYLPARTAVRESIGKILRND